MATELRDLRVDIHWLVIDRRKLSQRLVSSETAVANLLELVEHNENQIKTVSRQQLQAQDLAFQELSSRVAKESLDRESRLQHEETSYSQTQNRSPVA